MTGNAGDLVNLNWKRILAQPIINLESIKQPFKFSELNFCLCKIGGILLLFYHSPGDNSY